MNIPVKVYEEIKKPEDIQQIEWVDMNGINTPYAVTWVIKEN